jgi:hypothetical protein
MSDWKNWAQRRAGRQGNVPADPGSPSVAAPPILGAQNPSSPGALPPPPAGYGYVMHPQLGWMLAPLSHVAPAPQVLPLAPPQTRATPQAAAFGSVPSRPIESTTLVKSGNRAPDTYALLLANVPDLLPPGQYDAMTGNPDPAVAAELRGFGEFNDLGGAVNPEAPPRAYLRAPSDAVAPLSSGHN